MHHTNFPLSLKGSFTTIKKMPRVTAPITVSAQPAILQVTCTQAFFLASQTIMEEGPHDHKLSRGKTFLTFTVLLSTYILFNYWSPLNQTEITRGPSHKMIPEGAPFLKNSLSEVTLIRIKTGD